MASEVQRYDLEQGGGYDSGGAFMNETVDGDWVHAEDYAALEARLKALEWTPIMESNLPKVGDEVGGWDRALARPDWLVRKVTAAFVEDVDIPQWARMGYTHRRPINAPVAAQAHGEDVSK